MNLRKERLQHGLRLLDVALESGISVGYLSLLERGLRPLSFEMRMEIARAIYRLGIAKAPEAQTPGATEESGTGRARSQGTSSPAAAAQVKEEG